MKCVYLFKGTLPPAAGSRTGTAVRAELASFFVLCFLRVYKRYATTSTRVLAGEHHITGHLFHGQVADIAQLAPACWTARQFRPAIGAHQMPALALQDWRQDVVEANGALEQAG